MNTIKVKDYSKINLEMVAHEAITPGMILQERADGKAQKHADVGENALPYIALEDELQGGNIDTAIDEANPVQVWVPNRGCEANLILTTSQTVVVGDLLESAGNGMVQKHIPGGYGFGKQIVGQAITAVTTTGTARRIQVRIF
jgi:hypothetical protein